MSTSDASNGGDVPSTPRKPKPHFRRLRVEPYQPKEFLPGLREDDDLVDETNFAPYRYVVTFEVRSGWRKKWRKVKGYA